MKNQKGITIVSLVLYVIVMIIVLGVMSMILGNFYNNTSAMQGNVEEVVKFNKFNNYFLKEVKANNNKIDRVESNYILFSSGNLFSMSNGIIYFNNIQICDGVKKMNITQEDDNIINVTIEFESFKKTIRYKVENIY